MQFPAVKCAAAFIIGILLNNWFTFSFTILVLTASIILILIFLSLLIRNRIFNLPASFLLYILIIQAGLFTAEVNKDTSNLLPPEIIKEDSSIIYGKIEELNLIMDKEISFVIRADSIAFSNSIFKGDLKLIGKFRSDNKRVLDSVYSEMLPGYKIVQTGRFTKGRERRNPGEFNYNNYLRNKGFSGIISSYHPEEIRITKNTSLNYISLVFKVRRVIDRKIYELHSFETASLLRGLILADRSGVEYEKKTEFINSGVMHVLAVSGLHTGYVALIFILLFGRFNIVLRSILTIAGLFCFLILTGIPVSVFRAVVMTSLVIAAVISNRTTNIYNSLAVAALIVLIFFPYEIYNPGFQLSFTAVLSIAVIYPILNNILIINSKLNPLFRGVILFMSVTVAAQIGTLPITVFYFGKLSIISIAANLFVIPLIGFIIAAAAVTLFIVPFIPVAAGIYASSNELFTSVLFRITEMAGNWEYAFLRINNLSPADLIIFYFAIGFSLYFFFRWGRRNALILVMLISINAILFSSFDNREVMPDGKFSLLMIDVGQGDASLMKFPDGTTFLIDGGEANKEWDNGERIIIPLMDYLNIDQLDYAYISHLDLDHYGGIISLLNKKKIRHLLKAPPDYTEEDKKLEVFLKKIGQSYSYYGQEIMEFGSLKLYSLHDENEVLYSNLPSNDRSGVVKVVYGNTSVLFTGDIHKSGERYYTAGYADFLQSDILKVSHHGSKSSTSAEFIKFVNGEFALISAGYKNRFNHPAAEVIERLKLSGCRILRTDLNGAVLLQSDGDSIKEIDWKLLQNN